MIPKWGSYLLHKRHLIAVSLTTNWLPAKLSASHEFAMAVFLPSNSELSVLCFTYLSKKKNKTRENPFFAAQNVNTTLHSLL